MARVLVLAALACLTLGAAQGALDASLLDPPYDLSNVKQIFYAFILKYQRHYQGPLEFKLRLQIFSANLKKLQRLNDAGLGPARVNKYSDRTDDEVRKELHTDSTLPPYVYPTDPPYYPDPYTTNNPYLPPVTRAPYNPYLPPVPTTPPPYVPPYLPPVTDSPYYVRPVTDPPYHFVPSTKSPYYVPPVTDPPYHFLPSTQSPYYVPPVTDPPYHFLPSTQSPYYLSPVY